LLGESKPAEVEIEWFFNAARVYSLLLLSRCDAWRQFCTAKGIDGEAYLRMIPASQTIEQGEAIARETACSIREADDWLQTQRGAGSQVKRLESYLHEMETVCALFVAHWK
jgi:hypothetical protein